MRNLTVLFVLALLGLPHPLSAGDGPVVVELFTSQGCSSCPAADAILTELSNTEGIIPLALHVDYWDYLGWKDSFASPAYSKRQRAYAEAAKKRTIYTPQVVVQGISHAIGNQREQVEALIRQHTQDADFVSLDVHRDNGSLIVKISALKGAVGPQVVELVRYRAHETVMIRAGENVGKRIDYSNIVTAWVPLGEWDGEGEYVVVAPISGTSAAVILVQTAGHGQILAARIVP